MNEEFKFGELVEVRDHDNQDWVKRHYVGTMPNCKYHWTMMSGEDPSNFEGVPTFYQQIRKIKDPAEEMLTEVEQPETFEQRLDKFEAILNGAIAHINEQIASLKNSIQ